MPDVNGLYPAPPAPSQSLLSGDPSKILDLVGKANQLSIFNAHKAVGDAYSNALNPDGSIDQEKLASGLHNSAARPILQEAMGHVLTQRGQDIANKTAQFEQLAKQNQFVVNGLGTLADDKSPTLDKVRNFVVTAARNTNIPSAMLNSWVDGLPRDPAKLKEALVTMRNMAIGSGELSTPTQTGITPQGAPITGTRGQFNQTAAGVGNGGAGPAGGGIVTALSPAAAGAAAVSGPASASAGIRLREAADMAPTAKAMLGNLEEDLKHFTAGPGADWTRVAKAAINRNVPLPKGLQFDPASIASQEQFNKQALQLAQQQFGAIGGTGTDAKFASAFETNPHETLSHLGNQGVIRLLKGNQDAISAKNQAWQTWKQHYGEDSYDQFSQDFNKRFDPRTFQFRYMSKPERQQYIDRMDKNDRAKFLEDLTHAHKEGWIKFEAPKE